MKAYLKPAKNFQNRLGQLGLENDTDNGLFLVYDVYKGTTINGETVWCYKYLLLDTGEHRSAPVWCFNDTTRWLKDEL